MIMLGTLLGRRFRRLDDAGRNGISEPLKTWLSFFASSSSSFDDDASRGLRDLSVTDVSAYFDVEAMRSFLGSNHGKLRCAKRFKTVTYVRGKNATVKESLSAFPILKFGGGSDLASLRNSLPDLSKGDLFAISPRGSRKKQDS